MNDDASATSRRRFLAGVGVVATGAVAGCSGGEAGGATITTAAETLSTPFLGPDDAPVTVSVFKDFACPHCATFAAQAEPKIRSEYVDPGVVRFEHCDFPIPVEEPASYQAANAARAVQVEADDAAFFDYADLLFENQSDLGLDTYPDLAESVDGETVREAAEGRIYRKTIDATLQTGLDRGVRGTPTVFVDGEQVEQWSWDTFSSMVENARDD
jgi:protein-disulfide isomerase